MNDFHNFGFKRIENHSKANSLYLSMRIKKMKGSIDSFHRKANVFSVSTMPSRMLLGTILLFLCFPIMIWKIWNQSNPLSSTDLSKPLFESILHNHDACQVTQVFPFRVGCPKTCRRATYIDEPMYRMSMAWYLGMPDLDDGIAYDRGINYQCPIEFVNNFRNAAKEMGYIQTIRDVQIKFQPRMHLSLNYLCCLRKNETDWVREVMYKWVLDNYPYSLSVKFDKFQCWHERNNSVTTIIVADEQSQRTLIKMSNDIEDKLLEKGIPTEVHRSQQ
jgi:hypothetical protein